MPLPILSASVFTTANEGEFAKAEQTSAVLTWRSTPFLPYGIFASLTQNILAKNPDTPRLGPVGN